MLKLIGLAVVLLIGAVLIVAAMRPDTFRVQRTASIQAPPEKIFPLINDFRRWDAWSPYEHLDPAMKREIVSRLSNMKSKEASDYLMELLK